MKNVMTIKPPHGSRAAAEHLAISAAIRAGRLTRRQFGTWLKKRLFRPGIVVSLRESDSVKRPVRKVKAPARTRPGAGTD